MCGAVADWRLRRHVPLVRGGRADCVLCVFATAIYIYKAVAGSPRVKQSRVLLCRTTATGGERGATCARPPQKRKTEEVLLGVDAS